MIVYGMPSRSSCVPTTPALPPNCAVQYLMAHHRHPGAAWMRRGFLLRHHAAHRRIQPKRAEEIAEHHLPLHEPRITGAAGGEQPPGGRRRVGERPRLRLPSRGSWAPTSSAGLPIRRPRLQRDKRRRVAVRQRPNESSVDDAHDRRARPDRERDRDRGDGGECRTAAKRANDVREVGADRHVSALWVSPNMTAAAAPAFAPALPPPTGHADSRT